MSWLPIIEISKQNVYICKLAEITDALIKHVPHFKDIHGFDSDRLGTALFLFYYARYTGEEKYADIAFDLFSTLFDQLNSRLQQAGDPATPAAFASLGWVLALLAEENFIEADSHEIMGELDAFLAHRMITEMKAHQFDYLSGSLNKALYFLAKSKDVAARSYLEKLVDTIEAVCDKERGGGFTFSIKGLDETGNIISSSNLGLAHGMPGIAWFLSRISEQGLAVEKAGTLVEGFISYILQQQLDTSMYLSNFPRYAFSGQILLDSSRLAWCYGDLGIAACLWQVAGINQKKEWAVKAIEVLKHSTRRCDPIKNEVIDACLCHGTAGIAHIYNRMFLYTGVPEFKQAALYWFDETLKMAQFTDGYAGYKWWRGTETGWEKTATIFAGVSGIGLAIMAAVSDIEPHWDRVLLLS